MIRKKQTNCSTFVNFSSLVHSNQINAMRQKIDHARFSLAPIVCVCSFIFCFKSKTANQKTNKQINEPSEMREKNEQINTNWQCSIKLNPMMWKVAYIHEKNVALTFINGTFAKLTRTKKNVADSEQNNKKTANEKKREKWINMNYLK